MNPEVFVRQARKEMKDAGIKVRFVNRSAVRIGSGEYIGYFDHGDRQLVVAECDDPADWLAAFLHEYCHFKQWYERRGWYLEHFVGGEDPVEAVLEHFAGKTILSSAEIKSYCAKGGRIERDCERRVLKMIDEYRLTLIDPQKYAKLANAYIVWYYALPKIQRWYRRFPGDFRPLLLQMPNKILTSDKAYFALANDNLNLLKKC